MRKDGSSVLFTVHCLVRDKIRELHFELQKARAITARYEALCNEQIARDREAKAKLQRVCSSEPSLHNIASIFYISKLLCMFVSMPQQQEAAQAQAMAAQAAAGSKGGRAAESPRRSAPAPAQVAAPPPQVEQDDRASEYSTTLTSVTSASGAGARASSESSSVAELRRARAKMSLPELGSELDHHHSRFQVCVRHSYRPLSPRHRHAFCTYEVALGPLCEQLLESERHNYEAQRARYARENEELLQRVKQAESLARDAQVQ